MKRRRIRRRLLQLRKFLLLRCQFRLSIRQPIPCILHALILRFDCPRIADFANQPALFLNFIRLCRAFLQCLFRILQFLKTLHQRLCGCNFSAALMTVPFALSNASASSSGSPFVSAFAAIRDSFARWVFAAVFFSFASVFRRSLN